MPYVGSYVYHNGEMYRAVGDNFDDKRYRFAWIYLKHMLTGESISIDLKQPNKLRSVEPVFVEYQLTHLTEKTPDKVYLSLLKDDGEVREDVFVSDKKAIEYLVEWDRNGGDPLTATFLELSTDKVSFKSSDTDPGENLTFERLVKIDGCDLGLGYLYEEIEW